MEPTQHPYSHIKGWGIDADPNNEPNYPIKNYTGDDHRRSNYDRPEQQPVNIELLRSIERPEVSAVFGTSVPPAGWSGGIRRFAFRYSEGSMAHWFPLILADRIDSVEGIIKDIREGSFPDMIAERGWTAEWKYNKKGVIRTALISVAALTAAVVILRSRKK